MFWALFICKLLQTLFESVSASCFKLDLLKYEGHDVMLAPFLVFTSMYSQLPLDI